MSGGQDWAATQIATAGASTPLQQGIEAIDAYCGDEAWVIAATCRGLLRGYDARWSGTQESISVYEIEATYASPLYNIDTRHPSRTHRIAGKIDKLADQDGLVLFDHKTTSNDISDPNSPYWRQLQVESQPHHYELLLLQNGVRLDRIVWDVVRKPQIKPKKLSAAVRRAVTSLGEYCGFRVSDETQSFFAENDRENAELFELRVASEALADPERYFARRSVARIRAELAEYAKELWQISDDIRAARRDGTHFRNSGACMLYNSPCDYLGICSGHDTPDSDRWTRRDNVHEELGGGVDGEREVLTNSRLRCFQTCRRKHFYRYELGIERVDADEREALFFGSCWHAGLDAWWRAMDQQRKEKCDDSCAGKLDNEFDQGSVNETGLAF